MRGITEMLVTGGLVLSLILTGCGQGGGDTNIDAESADKEPTAQVTKDNTDTKDAGTTEASASAKEATLQDLNGWWKVVSLSSSNDGDQVDESAMNQYAELFHCPCVFKVNSGEGTYELNAFDIELSGTIESEPIDGWFILNVDAGAGIAGFMTSDTARCRMEDDAITIEVKIQDGNSEETVVRYACAADQSLSNKAVTDSVFQYVYDTYIDYRDSNLSMSVNWFDTPQILAENDECQLVLWGTGETEDAYVLMTGVTNGSAFPLLVSNFYLGPNLTVNGNIPLEPSFGCRMFAKGAITGLPDGLQAYDCPIYVSKDLVPDGLTSVSGTFTLTSINFTNYTTLDFDITL